MHEAVALMLHKSGNQYRFCHYISMTMNTNSRLYACVLEYGGMCEISLLTFIRLWRESMARYSHCSLIFSHLPFLLEESCGVGGHFTLISSPATCGECGSNQRRPCVQICTESHSGEARGLIKIRCRLSVRLE